MRKNSSQIFYYYCAVESTIYNRQTRFESESLRYTQVIQFTERKSDTVKSATRVDNQCDCDTRDKLCFISS